MKNFKNNRKAFSLVELVIVILIIAVLAVAVFAGGSKTIRKSQVSRTVSDLHNFSIAAETLLNENPSVANIDGGEDKAGHVDIAKIAEKFNALLSSDYKLTAVTADVAGNITATGVEVTGDGAYLVYKSDKTDAWGNNYYVVLDSADHNGGTEFYVTVISAGPNAKTVVNSGSTGAIDSDDIFMLAEYKNGDVASATYDWSTAAVAPVTISGGTAKTAYVGAGANYNF